MAQQAFHSGFVTIVGRPNVGKSTLLNSMVGEKIAIVSDKPQTTRNRIMGVVTGEDWQMVFLDTPGIHNPRNRLGNYMMQSVRDAMDGMDCIVTMVDVTQIGNHDRKIAEEMAAKSVPALLVFNKIDLIPHEKLLELLAEFKALPYKAMIPVSAKTGDGLDDLKREIVDILPEGPKYFPDDMMTDQPERLIVAEMIFTLLYMFLSMSYATLNIPDYIEKKTGLYRIRIPLVQAVGILSSSTTGSLIMISPKKGIFLIIFILKLFSARLISSRLSSDIDSSAIIIRPPFCCRL